MMEQLKITAPAKINLTLDITGKRADGYHELATVMHQITLADTIFLMRRGKNIALECSHKQLAGDAQNLAFRAADFMLKNYLPRAGVAIRLIKRIPIGAGLAGGSTDAAAVIQGISRLFGLHLSLSELCQCGAQIGADVPFCIAGGTALCTGKGEKIHPLQHGPHLHLVVVKPDFSLSTAAVFQQFDQLQPDCHPNHPVFLQAWEEQNLPVLSNHICNILEKVSLSSHPEIGTASRRLIQAGALAAQMSGSGPAVFGIFPDAACAAAAAHQLSQDYAECFTAESYYSL